MTWAAISMRWTRRSYPGDISAIKSEIVVPDSNAQINGARLGKRFSNCVTKGTQMLFLTPSKSQRRIDTSRGRPLLRPRKLRSPSIKAPNTFIQTIQMKMKPRTRMKTKGSQTKRLQRIPPLATNPHLPTPNQNQRTSQALVIPLKM